MPSISSGADMTATDIKLTENSHGMGCGCKLDLTKPLGVGVLTRAQQRWFDVRF
jgi:selenophosphate synthase